MTLVVDDIGLLVTNDPALGEGPLGLVRDASVVVDDGVVVSVGSAGQVADERIDAEGACVLPGFVDSHSHLVFAGDRSDWISQLARHVSLTNHMESFSRGVIDLGAVIFFLSLTALFLYLTHKVVESRRWK